MEIFFSIIAGIFAIAASVFGVRNRIRNTKLGDGSYIRNSRERLDNIIHNHQRLEQDKDRIQELDNRDDGNIERCKDISSRIRKREQEATTSE